MELSGLTIESITEVFDVPLDKYSQGDGYQLNFTDNSVCELLIDNGQNCCESWGYLASNDVLEEFYGAEIVEATITDMTSDTKFFDRIVVESEGSEYEVPGCVFITLRTTKGDLQLVAYNAHNGYYGHDVVVKFNNRTEFTDRI